MADLVQDILLPPPFELRMIASGDALAAARDAVAAGAGAGTLVWAPRPDLFDCAVVLEPETPLVKARPVIHVALVALGDTLAALGPPNKPIAYGWPDRIAVDGGTVGGVRLVAPPDAAADAVPDWLVVGATLRLAFDAQHTPGQDPGRTALHEEGFGDLDAPMLVESFSRHLLYWMDRWESDGFVPVGETWLSRLADRPGGDGAKHGLDPVTGDLLILDGASPRPQRRPLDAALAASDWAA